MRGFNMGVSTPYDIEKNLPSPWDLFDWGLRYMYMVVPENIVTTVIWYLQLEKALSLASIEWIFHTATAT